MSGWKNWKEDEKENIELKQENYNELLATMILIDIMMGEIRDELHKLFISWNQNKP